MNYSIENWLENLRRRLKFKHSSIYLKAIFIPFITFSKVFIEFIIDIIFQFPHVLLTDFL